MTLFTRYRGLLNADMKQLSRGLAAFGSAEMATRVVRILTIVVIARQVSPTIMGLAALALSLFEIVRVLANAGIGQRIIAADDDSLAAVCNTAHRLFWLWCLMVCAVQLMLSGILALTGMQDIARMLAILSGVYLLMPGGLVQAFLLMREERFGTIASIAAGQTIADHLLTLGLVLIWPSAWAIVLPKLLTAPLWLIGMRRARRWAPSAKAGLAPWRDFIGFGAGILVCEMTNAARAQLDKLLIGAFFGVQALGIYYFAFNAGLGMTTSFIAALGQVLFPRLSAAPDAMARRRRCRQGLVLGLVLFLPVLSAQVGLANWYVPLVFGEQWRDAAPLVAVLALGGVPMIFAAVASAWLRANNTPGAEALMTSLAAAAALGGILAFSGATLLMAAAAYVGGLALVLIPGSLYAIYRRHDDEHAVIARRVCA